jgi:hypothetical protein
MIKKIIELLNQLFVTYTIWFQNGTNILWKKPNLISAGHAEIKHAIIRFYNYFTLL